MDQEMIEEVKDAIARRLAALGADKAPEVDHKAVGDAFLELETFLRGREGSGKALEALEVLVEQVGNWQDRCAHFHRRAQSAEGARVRFERATGGLLREAFRQVAHASSGYRSAWNRGNEWRRAFQKLEAEVEGSWLIRIARRLSA